jgi:hypothetical protein
VQIYGGRYKSDGANQLGVPYKFSNVDLTPAEIPLKYTVLLIPI